MKSLTYMLTRTPQGFDDCLDYAQRSHLLGASLTLETTEIFTVRPVGRQLIAKFEFMFSDRLVICEKIMGGCLSYESEKKQQGIVQAANERLKHHLEKVRFVHPEIKGSEKRFSKTQIFRFKPSIIPRKAV